MSDKIGGHRRKMEKQAAEIDAGFVEAKLRDRIAELEAAAKTWENEAERRSRRYEQCVLRAEAAEEVAQLWLNNFKTAEATLERVRRLPDKVPTNWLDPILTGEAAILRGRGPYYGSDIEHLLLAVKKRIADELAAALKEEKR